MNQQINLYQAQFRDDKGSFSAKTLLRGGAAVVSALLAIAAFHGWQIFIMQGQVASLEHQISALKLQSSAMDQSLAAAHADTALADKVKRLEDRLNSQQQLKALLNDDLFDGGQGYSRYLIALARQHIAGLWLTGITLTGAGRNLSLRGKTVVADLVPRYLQNLSRETLLQGMEFRDFQLSRSADKPKSQNFDTFDFLVATSAAGGNKP